MKNKFIIGPAIMLCCALAAFAVGQTRDPLSALKRAITQAGATALTTQQETDLTTLITNFKSALPTEPDAALEAAQDAYNAAILAGSLTTAQTQAATIAARTAELKNARLQAEAQFAIAVLANLKAGGQLDALSTKYDEDRLLGLVFSLIGRGGARGIAR